MQIKNFKKWKTYRGVPQTHACTQIHKRSLRFDKVFTEGVQPVAPQGEEQLPPQQK